MSNEQTPGDVVAVQLVLKDAQLAGAALEIGTLRFENTQLRFLLSQVPMIDVPKMDAYFWAGRAVTPFAYIHPKTLARVIGGATTYSTQPWEKIGRSPTKWVSTSLMPEDRVVFTPNALPGIVGNLMEAGARA